MIGILACQAIRGQHGDDADGAVADGIAQGIEAGTVETAPTVSLVAEYVLVGDDVATGCCPRAQGGELAVNGLEALLALC